MGLYVILIHTHFLQADLSLVSQWIWKYLNIQQESSESLLYEPQAKPIVDMLARAQHGSS